MFAVRFTAVTPVPGTATAASGDTAALLGHLITFAEWVG